MNFDYNLPSRSAELFLIFCFLNFLFVISVGACVSRASCSSVRMGTWCQGDSCAYCGIHRLKLRAIIPVWKINLIKKIIFKTKKSLHKLTCFMFGRWNIMNLQNLQWNMNVLHSLMFWLSFKPLVSFCAKRSSIFLMNCYDGNELPVQVRGIIIIILAGIRQTGSDSIGDHLIKTA